VELLKLYILILSAFLLGLTGCAQNETMPAQEPAKVDEEQKLIVYTTLYPIQEFTSTIGGDRVQVINLVPPGTEAHDFEPSPRELIQVSGADLFIYNGSGFEGWIEKVLQAIDTSKMLVLNLSEHVDLLSSEETMAHEQGHEAEHKPEEGHGHEAEQGHNHPDGEFDPHFWLDPIRASEMALAIKHALTQHDPKGKERYEANYEQLAVQFKQLDADFREMVSKAGRKDIVVSHNAFGYVSHQYGLEQIAISGLSPSAEPSPKRMQEIIIFAKEHNVKYILFETLVNGKIAQMIKEEIGAEALALNPIEGLTEEEIGKGKTYFTVMQENLENLAIALESK
jgi:zinc transport system substrate-binding protein